MFHVNYFLQIILIKTGIKDFIMIILANPRESCEQSLLGFQNGFLALD